ncbi:MAG: hypothetical protein KAJ62_08410 [Desulfobacteraceae bacterium]|nr:hypothetical protein [Desulfobacteraceae bacterium]
MFDAWSKKEIDQVLYAGVTWLGLEIDVGQGSKVGGESTAKVKSDILI